MPTFSASSLYRKAAVLLGAGLLWSLVVAGCANNVERHHRESHPNPYLTSDTRHPIPLSGAAGREHRAVMLQHLETIQAIVNALVEEDYELAQGLAESHLGYFTQRRALAMQEVEKFPPSYHELTIAHHEAAGELARSISMRDLKQILPPLNNVLKTCVACHLEYKVGDRS